MTIKRFAKEILRRLPVLQGFVLPAYRRLRSSAGLDGYKLISEGEITRVKRELAGYWHNRELPRRQRALVEQQLTEYRNNLPNPVFDALTEILKRNISNVNDLSLLEIGCSSGYYYDVLRIKGILGSYRGCDYSEVFIALAHDLYPGVPFDVEDATDLHYRSESFDIVVSGCCILHIADYERAISEAARVSRGYVVFHRTPVMHLHGPIFFRRKAYGFETMEIHFNEQKLVELFSTHRLFVVDVNTHSISWDAKRQDAFAMKTYLCKKTSNLAG